jgi:hypothetical protein
MPVGNRRKYFRRPLAIYFGLCHNHELSARAVQFSLVFAIFTLFNFSHKRVQNWLPNSAD